MENTLQITRTPELIAAEINSIKSQTKAVMVYNAIEIGRRLAEAKSQLPHGEWGKWLEESVDYSKSTANNLMRIFEEYGSQQIALFGETAPKFQALGDLNYSQLVALLTVPEEERESFIEEHDVENLSTRELEKLIKERDQERKSKEEALAAAAAAEKKAEEEEMLKREQIEKARALEKELEMIEKQVKEAEAAGDPEELERLEDQLKETDEKLTVANTEIENLKKQLKVRPLEVTPTTIEVTPPDVLAELEALRKSDAEAQFKARFEVVASSFSGLLEALDEIEEETKEKYTNVVKNLLHKMEEQL